MSAVIVKTNIMAGTKVKYKIDINASIKGSKIRFSCNIINRNDIIDKKMREKIKRMILIIKFLLNFPDCIA